MVYQRIINEERVPISIRLKKNWEYQLIANVLNRSKGTSRREVSRVSIIDFGEFCLFGCRCPTKGKQASAN
jgi:IS30 family transposase